MSPQPILNFHDNPSLQLTPDAIHERPEVCAKIAQCIALWSWVDTQVGTLYVTLLGADKKRAAAAWINMLSDTLKERSLRTAGLSVLSAEDNDLLENMLAYLNSRKKTRDKLAHWYWGVCPEIKDGLVMVDPKYLIVHRATAQSFLIKNEPIPFEIARVPYSEIRVWTVNCLKDVASSFEKTADIVNGFMTLVSRTNPEERERLRRALSTDVHRA